MAGLAISLTIMVELRAAPTIGAMAQGALTLVMVRRPCMAGLAISKAAVIESGPAPAITVVTLGALALVMVGRP